MMRVLCEMADLPEGKARAFAAALGGFTGLFAVHCRGEVQVYVNACPHIGAALDTVPGRFLSADGARIVCGTHGAEFRPQDGVCTKGPCLGDRLEAIRADIVKGQLLVPHDAGL